MGHDDFERIQPAELEIATHRAPTSARAQRPSVGLAIALVILSLAVVAVVVVLPRLVAPVNLPSAATPAAPMTATANAPSGGSRSQPGGAASTPWELAQKERERRAAKAALDDLLKAQFDLQERGVQNWAAEEYAKGTALAKAGDEFYRTNNYRDAEQQYRAGAIALQALLDGMQTRLQERLAGGIAALEKGDAATAQRLFAEALAMDSSNAAAQAGAARAANIDQVLALMTQAANAEAAGNGDESTRIYREAIALDGEYAPARKALEALQQKANAKRYATLVSAGYAALTSGNTQQAKANFQSALALRPGASEAQDGLQQATFQSSQGSLTRLLKQAEQASASERWQQALDSYASALVIDGSLSAALQGKRVAEARLALDAALEQIVRAPQALAAGKTLDSAERVVKEAEAIASPGPRLQAQVIAARNLVTQWRTKVAFVLRSDGSTEVTLFRVGTLGSFTEKRLELAPGRYIAVGQRSGYRDVRVEFSVEPGEQGTDVNVQCRERI